MTRPDFTVTPHGGIDPGKESAKLVAQHLSAYRYCRPLAEGGKVLEIGHGNGYGSNYLAEVAESVVAIDLFEENVLDAQRRYQKSNLEFKQMNATDLDFADNTFDLICSFQVIEHIPQAQLPAYAREIRRVLKPGGKICLTTLNLDNNCKPGQFYNKSPDHDKEFTSSEYAAFMKEHFDESVIYGLYPGVKMALMERLKKWSLTSFLGPDNDPVQKFYRQIQPEHFAWRTSSNLTGCIDLMALCGKRK